MEKISPTPPFFKGGDLHTENIVNKRRRDFFSCLCGCATRNIFEYGTLPLNKGGVRGIFFSILSIISLFFLTSCTSTLSPPTPPSPSVFSNPQDKSAWLSSLQTWQAQGSFGVRKEHDAWSGTFEWNQLSKQNYRIHFYGPFGVGNTYLSGNGHRVVWQDNDEKTIASTPDEVVCEKTGFLFPVSYLYYWILGQPAPGRGSPGGVSQEQWDSEGRLIHFYQAGWEVTYITYYPIANGELPSLIRLKHENIQLKLVIRQWKIGR